MRLPAQAVEGIVFRRRNGNIEYLMLKRLSTRGDFWQPMTGGVEEGETTLDALKREIREETGIVNIRKIIENLHVFGFQRPKVGFVKEYAYGVEIGSDDQITIDCKEHSEFKWCSYEEALRLLKWDDNKIALKNLHALLSQSIIR